MATEAAPLRVVGMISGTSVDAIDMALIETDGERALGMGATGEAAYRPGLAAEILACAAAGAPAAEERARLSRLIAEDHAAALGDFLAGLDAPPYLIGFHGQTVLHRPEQGVTIQLGDAQLLADRIGLPVAAEFRLADVAAGGQGAPMAPAWHGALAERLARPCAFLNIGGVANATLVAEDGSLSAFDTGPGNVLLDEWLRRRGAADYDRGGAFSAAGRVNEARLAAALADPWFDLPPPKSLDRYDFSLDIVEGLSTEDGAATLAAFTAAAVAKGAALWPIRPKRWLVCGGGRKNPTLMAELASRLGDAVPVEAEGFDGDALEAQAMAFLAARTLRRLPLSWPGVTGVPEPTRGGRIYRPSGVTAPVGAFA